MLTTPENDQFDLYLSFDSLRKTSGRHDKSFIIDEAHQSFNFPHRFELVLEIILVVLEMIMKELPLL